MLDKEDEEKLYLSTVSAATRFRRDAHTQSFDKQTAIGRKWRQSVSYERRQERLLKTSLCALLRAALGEDSGVCRASSPIAMSADTGPVVVTEHVQGFDTADSTKDDGMLLPAAEPSGRCGRAQKRQRQTPEPRPSQRQLSISQCK